MSAIAVLLDLGSDRVEDPVCRRVLDAAQDRGPDGSGRWIDGPIGLAHHSLASTPEEVDEVQPVIVGDLVGVFDGRLDNREELIGVLLARAQHERAVTDAELVVRAYREWREDAASHLLGDFGLAVWDRSSEQLYCARDHLGVRPIYYWRNGRTLVIGTDIRTALAHPDLVREPDEGHVADLLCHRMTSTTSTLYREVMRLPPAHTLRVDAGRVTTARYWDVDLHADVHHAEDHDYVEHFRELFADAVRCRLRCRGEATVSLSGGLDSSLVAAVAAERMRAGAARASRASTTSLVFPGEDCDESVWIDAVVGSLGIDSFRIPWSPLSWDGVLAEAARTAQLPPYPNATLDMFVRGGLHRTAVLSGVGGDQWMNGLPTYFRDLRIGRRYRELGRNLAQGGGPKLARAVIEGRARSALNTVGLRLGRLPRDEEEPAWFGPALRNRGWTLAAPAAAPVIPDVPRSKQQRLEVLRSGWEPLVFETSDYVASGGDLAFAAPFYDRRVVEFAFGLPESQRWHGPDGRWFSRRALDGLLPEAVVRRTDKAEFTAPYRSQVEALPLAELFPRLRVVELGWVAPEWAADLGPAAGRRPGGRAIETLWWRFAALEAWVRTAWAR